VACPNVASVAGGAPEYTNLYSVGARYQGKLGPAAVLAYVAYIGSGVVHNSTGPTAFNGLSFVQAGANVTVDGLSVFGNVLRGTVNGDYGVNHVGAVPSTGYGVGAKYAFGPYSIGGVYSQLDDQGVFTVSQRHAWVFAAAATYAAAPGLIFYLDYDYGQQHQGGVNFAGVGPATAFNDIKAQGVMFGTVVKW
jgi:hypothetical protein